MSTTAPAPFPVTAPPEALASDLCWLMYRANMNQKAEAEAAITESGLTMRKHQVLATALDADHTQTELARIIGLDKTTMMVTLDELERDGFAERRPLPTDRRARVVAVTSAGRKLLRKADAAFAAANERILACLPADERDVFLRALERLACPGCVEAREAGAVGDCIPAADLA
jgi:MarR family transcriptional regulator, transcriptional regulator for hemolysin